MAELVIGALVTVLVEKLASGKLMKLVASTRIHSKLQKWSDTLPLIQAVLVDAVQKHIQDNEPVQLWLNKLHHLAYEIDDVLDDLVTEATLHQLNKESHTSSSKVIKFVPDKLHTVKYNLKMSSKLDGITTKLLDLVNQKQLLGLTDGVKPSLKASARVEETSLVDKSEIIGREGDKEALLGRLLGSESSSSQPQNFNIVSIVGLGGIGKTTLARLLYNDEKVKSHFELMSWVCVSNEFDVFNISKAIFQAVGGGNQDFANLDLLHKAVSEKIKEKMFLIVLDDVWNEKIDKWESLRLLFTVGAAGSKVLVTTRNSMVAEVMKCVEPYSLELLSYEEAISLFAQHVLGSQKFDVHGALELHGKDIVKKCDRLPLALIALGRVFGKKSNVEEWVELLNSEIWNSEKQPTVLPALKLSYYDLPPHLKQMFVYCCLFPKDYTFDKNELVLLWMAEGFLYKSNGNNLMESFGRECFEELLSRSFFQLITDDDSHYTMHDLINDLATSVAGEFFLRLDDTKDVYNGIKEIEKCHHLSLITMGIDNHRFKAPKKGERLRTYLAINLNSYRDIFDESMNVHIELLPQLKFLRVLSLAYYNIIEVPEFICSLKHLRYLNFSYTKITCLPKQVGDLLNLQSLLVSRCKELSSLPNSLVKLINLRHLDISHTPNLNKRFLGISGLTGLKNLIEIVIGKDDVFAITDLKGLMYLQGELSIKGLQKVKDVVHAKEANLRQIKGICDLHMKWSVDFDDSRDKSSEYEVLEGLRPFEKLRSLEISYYGGTNFPSWVGDPSFVCLTKLTLRGCISCKHLPEFGQLPSLRELRFKGMDGLERLDFEFFGRFNTFQGVAFPSLEVLEFKDMKSWEEWSTSGADIAGAFPCLRELSMIGCEKLDVVAIELISPLWKLHVEGCSLKKLEILKCNNLVSLGEKEVQSVREVKISFCERLESYNCPSSIEKLDISSCSSFTTLTFQTMDDLPSILKEVQSIIEVNIRYCERLETYICPSSIERLVIYSCKSLTSLSFPTMDDLPSTLKHLHIGDCDNLEVSWLANNFLSSLEHFHILKMPNMRLFPEGCLVHLTELYISECDNIESIPDNGYGFLPSRCLKRLTISYCKNLKSFPYKQMESLVSLERMTINGCPSLDYSFSCGSWPPNLRDLTIREGGIQNFPTSLVKLELFDGKEVVTFGKGVELEISSFLHLLPSSLISLLIWDFKELKSVREGLQHLTSLQQLTLWNCPKVRDLPETILPSLSTLDLFGDVSPELIKKCSREGEYWPLISQIPDLSFPEFLP